MMSSEGGDRQPLDPVIRGFEEHLRAAIDVDQRANGMEAIVATTPEGSFPMGRSSSMLTELAPLLLVLKAPHLAVDHLTIDEPEAHLHPEMQVRVASFIAELVLHGIRITVTTHSDFFVSQLKNMMRLHSLRAAGCEPKTIDLPTVAPSQVRSLQFSRENGWCVARGPTSDGIDGVDESTFTQVMRDQYAVAADLINELLATTSVES
ncbi:AAA family ATPase [Candidatus Poriferisodalis sp.]|uniref:AAA family ATPase n=1 Tax=Candidatus Poriferisodalis sp. TaxID=3101277 RepID=UPI003AF7094F